MNISKIKKILFIASIISLIVGISTVWYFIKLSCSYRYKFLKDNTISNRTTTIIQSRDKSFLNLEMSIPQEVFGKIVINSNTPINSITSANENFYILCDIPDKKIADCKFATVGRVEGKYIEINSKREDKNILPEFKVMTESKWLEQKMKKEYSKSIRWKKKIIFILFGISLIIFIYSIMKLFKKERSS